MFILNVNIVKFIITCTACEAHGLFLKLNSFQKSCFTKYLSLWFVPLLVSCFSLSMVRSRIFFPAFIWIPVLSYTSHVSKTLILKCIFRKNIARTSKIKKKRL